MNSSTALPIPPFFDTVFYSDNMLEVESYLVQQRFVERLEKTQVVVGYGDSFVLLRTLYGTCGYVAYGTEADDCQVLRLTVDALCLRGFLPADISNPAIRRVRGDSG